MSVINDLHGSEIIKLYLEGKSPADLTNLFPYKRTTIKEYIRRKKIIQRITI